MGWKVNSKEKCLLLFSPQALGQSFFLVEAVIDVTNKQLNVVTKVDDWSLVQQFDVYLKTCLAGEWLKAQ